IGLTPAVVAEGLNTELAVRSATVAGPAGGTGVSSELGAAVTLSQSNVIDLLGQATGARALGDGSALLRVKLTSGGKVNRGVIRIRR
ncbi:MAG: hypothetical protein M3550_05185, partial [Actinomycetota bacterium]|nr:hypothetical protein [Actinomycetota bacterium]